jgi:hypothetical protein
MTTSPLHSRDSETLHDLRVCVARLDERVSAHQRGLDIGRVRSLQHESETNTRLQSLEARQTEQAHHVKTAISHIGDNRERIGRLEGQRESDRVEREAAYWRRIQALIGMLIVGATAGSQFPWDKLAGFLGGVK